MAEILGKIRKLSGVRKSRSVVSYALVLIAYIAIEAAMAAGSISNVLKSLLIPTCSYIVVALSLNLVVGYLGDLSLGHAGFMATGAFSGVVTAAILGRVINNDIVVLIIALLVGGIVSAVFGAIIGIPVLKLQGDYLAIVTLAFCQIIKTMLQYVYLGIDGKGLHFSFLDNNVVLDDTGDMIIKGAIGVSLGKKLSTFTAGVVLILITLFIIYNLIDSKHGRAIQACRDNKIAATSLGISTSNYKLLAFVISATLAGMAGALYGLNFASLKAAKFDFNLSIMILVYVVLGGLGNITGTIISTTLLLVLPEALRSFNDYRMIVYSIVLILVMLISNNATIMSYLDSFRKKLMNGKAGKEPSDV